MNLSQLGESINAGYYTLPVLDVIVDFPLEFIRLFFAKFEKEIFIIIPKCKIDLIERIERSVRDGKNMFLDTMNTIEFGLDSMSYNKKKSARDHEVEISFNIYGTKLKYTIKGPASSSHNGMLMNISRMKCGEFLDKFIDMIKEIYAIKDYARTYDGTLDTSNAALYKQPITLGQELNKVLTKFYLKIDFYNDNYRDQVKVKLLPNFEKWLPDYDHRWRYYRGIKFPESLVYDFQKKAFSRIEKSILSYMNRNGIWVNRFEVGDYGIEYSCYPSTNGDAQDPDYSEGYTYRKLQKEGLKGFSEKLKEFEGRDFRPEIVTFDDFLHDLIKQALPSEVKKRKK
jgi:hypothetical protein